jgi:hypothetical protein
VVKFVRSVLKQWIPLAVVIVALSGMLYLIPQQLLRQGANDPQIQQAEDAAAALAKGADPKTVVPQAVIDISQSMAPFRMVFDEAGRPLTWSGELNGKPPVPPFAVFDYVKHNGEDRITWQPEAGVRLATVIIKVEGANPGFVLSARSLREVEVRENQVLNLALLGMAVTLVASLVVIILLKLILRVTDAKQS